jgi:diacylglycerol kinase family enzyme
MTRVAVIAHSSVTLLAACSFEKSMLRVLEQRGVTDVFWREVGKSRFAPAEVKKALARDADLIFIWGGDGMVQRCVDVMAGSDATVAIVPAGPANLLATNLGIPKDIEQAVEIGLSVTRVASTSGGSTASASP